MGETESVGAAPIAETVGAEPMPPSAGAETGASKPWTRTWAEAAAQNAKRPESRPTVS